MNSAISQTKRDIGYWMISPDRNGGYAYAKVCSNGISFWSKNLKIIGIILSLQSIAT